VATSKEPFWAGGFGRWLSSGKNLAGLGLAACAVGAELVFGLGPLWPAIVVGAYGVGALVVPSPRVQLALGIGSSASAEELEKQLKVLDKAQTNKRLDDDLRGVLGAVSANLHDIVERWGELASAPDQQHTVAQMIGDYLPTSLQSYLDLPRSYATAAPAAAAAAAGRRSPHDELLDQLRLLQDESGKIRDAVFARTVDALDDQGRFLREKFRKSSLDLGD